MSNSPRAASCSYSIPAELRGKLHQAVCVLYWPGGLVLGIDLSELISLEKPEMSLLKLDPVTQARITNLLDKSNLGAITKRERVELERLVDKAEKIGLHNARALVEYR
jgi:hypothetical protein